MYSLYWRRLRRRNPRNRLGSQKGEVSTVEHAFHSFHLPIDQARQRLQGQTGSRFVHLLRFGSMSIEYFAPVGVDGQQPHEQDEIYVVASGSGEFVNGSQRHRFTVGDVMFVPAGVAHRFENFSDDFAVWVVFYGPRGGERG
jgi:mannose-6-phosphate isomerase-like protein (cupin superfamily)